MLNILNMESTYTTVRLDQIHFKKKSNWIELNPSSLKSNSTRPTQLHILLGNSKGSSEPPCHLSQVLNGTIWSPSVETQPYWLEFS